MGSVRLVRGKDRKLLGVKRWPSPRLIGLYTWGLCRTTLELSRSKEGCEFVLKGTRLPHWHLSLHVSSFLDT